MRDVNVKVEVNVQTEDEPTAVALQLQQGGRDARCEHEDEGEREPVTKVNDEGEPANGGSTDSRGPTASSRWAKCVM